MAKKKKQSDKFLNLAWGDLKEWAGGRIVSRGEKYQKQGRVSGLAITEDGNLVATVKGSDIYGTKILIMQDGRLESICTCPYTYNCKHGVAIVLEYLEQVKRNINIPTAGKNDERLMLIDGKPGNDETEDDNDIFMAGHPGDIGVFLKSQGKDDLVELVHELCMKYPEVDRYLHDRINFSSGNRESRIKHIRSQIREAVKEPGWQNYWEGQGFTPNFSEINENLAALLDDGNADDVISLGRELMSSGNELVETSNDEGETASEIEKCMPVIIRALEKSSLSAVEKLDFALGSVIEDQYGIFGLFIQYIESEHSSDVWDEMADMLLARLENLPDGSNRVIISNYKRNQISDWAINALEKSGRDKEIIPLCEKEAPLTASYNRLVKRLIETRQYDEAEKWIHRGISQTKDQWPGIASELRGQLLTIRVKQKNPQAVVSLRVYEYVDSPSSKAYQICKVASEKIKVWEKVRTCILGYLETGKLPWKQGDWPLPQPDIESSESKKGMGYPMIKELISIAILEQNPEKVLYWYDKSYDKRHRFGISYDEVAEAIKTYSPERSVDMWKARAEALIAQVNPKAYQEAVIFLKKAKKMICEIKKQDIWNNYIKELRTTHARKSRLIDELDRMDRKPIVNI